MRTHLAVIAGLVAAASASANTVTLKYTGAGAGRNVRVTLGSNTQDVFAGQLRHTASNGVGSLSWLSGPVTTFCTDLSEYVTSSGATYTQTALANMPVSSGWPAMGSAKASAVYALYDGAAGRQFGSDSDWAAAFQIALWEIVYDFNSSNPSAFNLGGGAMRATGTGGALSSSITSKISELFGLVNRTVAQDGLIGLSRNGAQDQLLQIVPLPPAAWAGLGMMGGMIVVRRMRRRG